MHKTHVFYGNQHVDSFYTGRTKWQIWRYKAIKLTKRTLVVLAVMSLMGWSSYLTTKVTKPVVVEAQLTATSTEAMPPVLQRIAKCESGGSQYDKNGQVILHANNDETVDIGKYQINETRWGKTAHDLGYDLTKEKDNEAMAVWIYENRGTTDWYSSAKCWQ